MSQSRKVIALWLTAMMLIILAVTFISNPALTGHTVLSPNDKILPSDNRIIIARQQPTPDSNSQVSLALEYDIVEEKK
jgi:hypothetical protein